MVFGNWVFFESLKFFAKISRIDTNLWNPLPLFEIIVESNKLSEPKTAKAITQIPTDMKAQHWKPISKIKKQRSQSQSQQFYVLITKSSNTSPTHFKNKETKNSESAILLFDYKIILIHYRTNNKTWTINKDDNLQETKIKNLNSKQLDHAVFGCRENMGKRELYIKLQNDWDLKA